IRTPAGNPGDAGWDTHGDNFPLLKDDLLPPTDRALAALLEDLAAGGLLDETLVIVMGEFGRSPKLIPMPGQAPGRDHWPAVFSPLRAGAGIPGGRLYGASDRQGAYPRHDRLTPGQLAATVYHALGIEPAAEVATLLRRPWPIVDSAPVLDLWGATG